LVEPSKLWEREAKLGRRRRGDKGGEEREREKEKRGREVRQSERGVTGR
jgi:hypothetical protein